MGNAFVGKQALYVFNKSIEVQDVEVVMRSNKFA
ncbi:hypothetical protein PEDI_41560 [Persicobacter diffluens]|uniref:Uncharacterized protein n=1 Tax=Persicobacter diffluens TaxID=981 RepID=A0AAN4W2C8_9BACT|nr:hypothetical protein PEDI_41560 [Persicobacter diffluens]